MTTAEFYSKTSSTASGGSDPLKPAVDQVPVVRTRLEVVAYHPGDEDTSPCFIGPEEWPSGAIRKAGLNLHKR